MGKLSQSGALTFRSERGERREQMELGRGDRAGRRPGHWVGKLWVK